MQLRSDGRNNLLNALIVCGEYIIPEVLTEWDSVLGSSSAVIVCVHMCVCAHMCVGLHTLQWQALSWKPLQQGGFCIHGCFHLSQPPSPGCPGD